MSKPLRLLGIFAPLAIAAVLFGIGAMQLGRYPALIKASATSGTSGPEASITLQAVPAIGSGAHPDWVSYLVQGPDGKFVHTTMIQLPAHALVHVTILQYDSGSDLRNSFMLQPQGVVGGAMNVNGKSVPVLDPKLGDVGHTFTIPQLGVSVPLMGVPDDAKNPCPNAPCTTNYDHNTVTFDFRTGAPGEFHWQCFVPCGTDFLYGNGGPMSTVGFMGGFVKVVA